MNLRRVPALAAGIVAVGGLLVGCGSTVVSAEGSVSWQRAAHGPLSARAGAGTVVVGDEVLVLGGSDGPPCPPNADCAGPREPGLRDGAAYDPVHDRWRPLADAPVPLYGPREATVGGIVYVATSEQFVGDIGGADDIPAALLAYSISDDSWTQLPMPEGGVGQLVALKDGRLLSYESSHENARNGDWLYDVGSRKWSQMPPDPLAPSFDRTAVVTDTGDVVLLAIDLVEDPGVRPSFYRAAVWHPADGSWRELPRSRVVGSDPNWHWSGGRVVNATRQLVDGGEVNNYGRVYPTGGMLDPATGEWTDLASWSEQEPGSGPRLSVAGTDIVTSGEWVLHVREHTWTRVPEGDGLPTQEFSNAVVGDRVVVFGGARFGEDGELLDDTWVWRMPQV